MRLGMILLAAIALGGALGHADTVVMKTGRRLTCKVIPPEEGDTTVRVILGDDESGSLLLPREGIERIEYDYDSRLDELTEEDYLGHYQLGLWCLKRALYTEAIARFRHAAGGEGVPDEVWFHLAQAYEQQATPDFPAAHRSYQAYLVKTAAAETTPARAAEAREAVQRLEKTMQDLGLAAEDAAPEEDEIVDGLEAGPWGAPRWGNAAEVSRVAFAAEDDNHLLRVEYRGEDHTGKKLPPNDAKAPVQLSLGGEKMDFSKTPVLRFRARCEGRRSVRFSVAVTTGTGYQWFESKLLRAPAEEWSGPLEVDLTDRTWKAEKTGWKHTAAVDDINRVRNLLFVIYNGRNDGTIYFEEIRRAAE